MTGHPHRPFWSALTWATMAVLAMAVMALLIRTWSLADAVRVQQKANTGTIRSTNKILKRVHDCTTPGVDCYERGQRQTAAAVANVNKVTILAAACADKPAQQTQDQIYRCVLRRLAHAPTAPPGQP